MPWRNRYPIRWWKIFHIDRRTPLNQTEIFVLYTILPIIFTRKSKFGYPIDPSLQILFIFSFCFRLSDMFMCPPKVCLHKYKVHWMVKRKRWLTQTTSPKRSESNQLSTQKHAVSMTDVQTFQIYCSFSLLELFDFII